MTVRPPARQPAAPRPVRARLDRSWLLGYHAPETAAPGGPVSVRLYWLADPGRPEVTAFGQKRSLAAWPAGQVVPVDYRLEAPALGERLELMIEAEAARCGWLAAPSDGCALPPVTLTGQAAAAGAINFGRLVLLNQARLETPQAAPGGEVRVRLEWQGLQRMEADYTVFVHLLAPDGRVYGQVDAWPVSGTRATSGWATGERIVDPYAVRVPAEAPPGAYQVEVGLYLLATGERLPVLGAEGTPVDDKVLFTGPVITRP
jgi:hypothetical protein